MAVYKIESDTAYPYLALLDGREIRNLPWFKGYSVQQDWHDLPVGFTEKVSLKSGGDFPHFSSNGTLVCSAKALQQLERLIADSVEIFKLNCVNCGDEDFYRSTS